MSKKSRRARKPEQDSSLPGSPKTLSELNKIYRREDPRNGIQRVSDPFNPLENNVFHRQSESPQTSIPTPAQIARFIRNQS